MIILLRWFVFFWLAAVVCGCNSKDKEIEKLRAELQANKQKEIAAAQAQYDLARAKGSLEETFLALKTLQTLGSGADASTEIERTRHAIELLSSLRIAKGEHRHEDVVKLASDLLDLFPDQAEARKDLKESGLIFRYLESALSHQQKCLGPNQAGKMTLITLKAQGEEKATLDLTGIAFHVQKAREFTDEAIKLDPQYEEALSVKKSIRQMENTVAYLVSHSIFNTVDAVRPRLALTFEMFHSGMVDAAKSRYDSPTDYWKRMGPSREQLEASFSQLTTNMDTRASFLSQLDAADVQSVKGTAIRAVTLIKQLQRAVFSPRGNLGDYKSDYLAVDTGFSKTIAEFSTAAPNVDAVLSDFSGFATTLVSYKLFKQPERTRSILQKHEALLRI